jgi:hypothetical protein
MSHHRPGALCARIVPGPDSLAMTARCARGALPPTLAYAREDISRARMPHWSTPLYANLRRTVVTRGSNQLSTQALQVHGGTFKMGKRVFCDEKGRFPILRHCPSVHRFLLP